MGRPPVDHTSETNLSKTGELMTIIACRTNKDIDVLFADGTIRKNACYNNFKKGQVAKTKKDMSCRTDRIGETNITNNGQKMTIIAYRNAKDIDVQFEDKTIREHITYDDFKKGNVHVNSLAAQAKQRIGETSTTTNGEKMTIVAYRSTKDIDVKFENDDVKKHVNYENFKRGRVEAPARSSKNRIGETSITNKGEKITIIAYENSKKITIAFEDGTTRENITYVVFKSGQIQKEKLSERIKKRTGEINKNNKYGTITITQYRTDKDIDVQFDDGHVRKNVTYKDFKNNSIKKQKTKQFDKNRIGETNIANNGEIITIIEYRKCTDIDIQFEDGTIRHNMRYASFKKGQIAKQKTQPVEKPQINRTGEINIAKNGMTTTIINYRKERDVDIKFNDGHIRTHVRYGSVQKGLVGYPVEYQTLKIGQLAYHVGDTWAFYVKCEKCGLSDIMTYEQMQAHSCCQN